MSRDLIGPQSTGPAGLRQLLSAKGPLLLPGCYDALGARLIESAGFDAAYMTGFGTSAGLLGRPDVGLLGLTDMVDNARRITNATYLPVVADADTGYGNALNVIQTVRLFEQAGVAGIHIEDQVAPKRCGHMDGKEVVSLTEMVAKVDAAVAARANPDFVIIARTDARAPIGFDAALERARACHDAGADLLFVEALEGRKELELVSESLPGVPLVFNWVEGGKTPPLTFDEIAELGFAVVLMPITTLLAAAQAMAGALASMRELGTPSGLADSVMGFSEFNETVGLKRIQELEQRFANEPVQND